MADARLPDLLPVVTPALTDLILTRQSGDTRDKKMTAAQLLSLVTGGDVSKVGTPVDNEIGVWTGDGTLEGDSDFLWNGTQLVFPTTGDFEAAPTIHFGSEQTGFYGRTGSAIRVTVDGTDQFHFQDLLFRGDLTGSGGIRNVVASATVPSLIPDNGDTNTGIGQSAPDELSLIAGGIEAVRYDESLNEIVQRNFHIVGITASVTQTQGQGELENSYNEVSVVANANDVVTAPNVQVGVRLVIVNNGANVLQVFPETSDDLGAGVNASITIAAGETLTALGRDGINWDVLYNGPSTPASGASFPLLAPADSAAAPSYSYSTDTDTGVFRASSNALGLAAGGDPIAQARFLGAGSSQFLIAPAVQQNNAALPSLGFGDGNTGFYESADNILRVAIAAAARWEYSSNSLKSINAAGPELLNAAASSSLPTFRPNQADPDTGVGWNAADSLVFVAGGVAGLFITEAAAVITVQAQGNLQLASSSAPTLLNAAGSATVPNVIPTRSDLDTGIGTPAADQLSLIAGGVEGLRVTEVAAVITATIAGDLTVTGTIGVNQGAGGAILNEDASSTNPTLVPNQADPDTGIGRDAVDGLALIAGAVDCFRVREIGGARAVGFYTTTPIVQQTGVAVTAGGIHAALVALGVFTA